MFEASIPYNICMPSLIDRVLCHVTYVFVTYQVLVHYQYSVMILWYSVISQPYFLTF